MSTIDLLNQIFQLCIIPLLGILAVYLTTYIKKKGDELAEKSDNELYKKYIEMLTETVSKAVITTNQTYTESLKAQNAFDETAQKEAFNKTKTAVLALLSDEAKTYLTAVFGDLDLLLQQSIEAEVNEQKLINKI